MKQLLLFLLVMMNMIAVCQQSQGFIISGKICDLPDSSIISLTKYSSSENKMKIAFQTYSKNEEFKLEGKIPREGEGFTLTIKVDSSLIDALPFSNKIKTKQIPAIELLLENTHIMISGSLQSLLISDSPDSISISGLPSHIDWTAYKNNKEKIDRLENQLTETAYSEYMLDNDVTNYNKRIIEIRQLSSVFIKSWIEANPNSLLTPLILLKVDEEVKWKREKYNSLSEHVKLSKYAIDLLELLRIEERLIAGSIAPVFEICSETGLHLNPMKIFSDNELTLIDFWASWCGPCRGEFKNLLPVFFKYNKYGFNILGVSIDEKEADWLNALKNEKLPWLNGRSLNKNELLRTYNIKQVPLSILVNKKGEILLKNPSSEELLMELEKITITKNKNWQN